MSHLNFKDLITHSAKGNELGALENLASIFEKAFLESYPEKHFCIYKKLYYKLCGGHFDEALAERQVKHFVYTCENGDEHYGPYWSVDTVSSIYRKISNKIPDYNFWDFYVTLQMIKSDNYHIVEKWFKEEDPSTKDKKYIELAINWLDDPDNPYGSEKIWGYLNGTE